MTDILEGWDREPASNVRVYPDNKRFTYSDGAEVEHRILRILKSSSDLSVASPELQTQITDWATEYHFSPHRRNLVAHLQIGAGTRVLELGAGCGAISRHLGEMGASLTSIEGSLVRARCAAERCRDLPNVRVACARFDQVVSQPLYDYVFLIGVLEYAACYSDSAEPYRELLQHAAAFLKPDGVLVVAIENQLGLKYFCGAPEDHLGRVNAGIEDRYSAKSARTFGRVELSRLLWSSGLHAQEFHFPFPDYKQPRLVLTDAGLEDPNFDSGELIQHAVESLPVRDPETRRVDEASVWPVVARNGIARDLANSLLALAGTERLPLMTAQPKSLAFWYTTHRKKEFASSTTFARRGGARRSVCGPTWLRAGATLGGARCRPARKVGLQGEGSSPSELA